MRLIPVLAVIALLTSCNGSGSLKAPTFAKEGDEVKYNEFSTKYQEAVLENEFANLSISLKDRVAKFSYSSYDLSIRKRDNKEYYKDEAQTVGTGEEQFDYNNKVGKMVGEIKYTRKNTSPEGNINQTSNNKSETYVQFGNANGTPGLILLNVKQKTYSLYNNVADNEKNFDTFVRNELSMFAGEYSQFNMYLPDASNARDFLFYIKDETQFTYASNKEDQINYEDYSSSSRLKLKAQIELADKKEAVRISYNYYEERTYRRNIDGFIKGDVETRESVSYIEYVLNAKDVNLQKASLDGYALEY